MNGVIKLHKSVANMIVDHSNMNSELECGGYLYGYIKKTVDGVEIIVIDAYAEMIVGTHNRFNFEPNYDRRAINYLNEKYWSINKRVALIGNYHSHGKYKAIFSEDDRNCQKRWINNRVALLYSPKYNEMIGDIIMRDGNVIRARVTTFTDYVYKLNSTIKDALPISNLDCELIYQDDDKPYTLKYTTKRK